MASALGEGAGCLMLVSSEVRKRSDVSENCDAARKVAQCLDLEPAVEDAFLERVSEVAEKGLERPGEIAIRFQCEGEGSPAELSVSLESDGRSACAEEPLAHRSLPLPYSQKRFGWDAAERVQEELVVAGLTDPLPLINKQSRELLGSLRRLKESERELQLHAERISRGEARLGCLLERLHTVVENLPDPAILFDSEGKLECRNGPARTLAEVTGYVVPFNLESCLGGALRGDTVLQQKVNGEDRHFSPKVLRLLGKDNVNFGTLLLLRDVSDLKLIDDLKSDLVGTLCHEIRGPVTSIRMGVLLLLDKSLGELNEDQQDLADMAKFEIERLLRMLNSFLDIQRSSGEVVDLRRGDFSVAQIISTSVSEMARSGSLRGVRVEAEFDEMLGDIDLFVDGDRIVYALNNLVSNAIKNSKQGRSVILSASMTTDAQRVQFSVQDEGEGVSKAHQQMIFNRYAKAPGNRKPGLGLGLALAKEFVELHGGSIGLESDEERGSRFYFELPLQ